MVFMAIVQVETQKRLKIGLGTAVYPHRLFLGKKAQPAGQAVS